MSPSLSRDCLDVLLRIREDGPSIEEYNPNTSIDCWSSEKICHLNTGPQNYPPKRKKSSDIKEVIELETLTLSNLENNESNRDVDSNRRTGFLVVLNVLLVNSF